ncbi:MAG: hypothetical protein QNJ41_14795 [Xenococcaceae cyanobacterium MO_188.B32]|nr:hypothetical protein [Xenococcaceae cyanobacterium MO_188.B32]
MSFADELAEETINELEDLLSSAEVEVGSVLPELEKICCGENGMI